MFFGRLSDAAGTKERPMPQFEGSIGADQLIELIATGSPGLAEMLRAPSVRICVNLVIQPRSGQVLVNAGDEIAFLPPMSGG